VDIVEVAQKVDGRGQKGAHLHFYRVTDHPRRGQNMSEKVQMTRDSSE
jgi:hypothetical protein